MDRGRAGEKKKERERKKELRFKSTLPFQLLSILKVIIVARLFGNGTRPIDAVVDLV